MTKIRTTSQNQTAVTLPKRLRDVIGIESGTGVRSTVTVRCDGDGIGLDVRIGNDIDAPGATTPRISSRQVELLIPSFMATAWGLAGAGVSWPDADAIMTEQGESRIVTSVDGWTPRVPVSRDALGETAVSAAVSPDPVRSHFPAEIWSQLPDADRVAVSMDCVDGEHVMVVTPTDEDALHTLAVTAGGPDGSQRQYPARELTTALGVRKAAEDRRVRFAWRVVDDRAIGTIEVADRD